MAFKNANTHIKLKAGLAFDKRYDKMTISKLKKIAMDKLSEAIKPTKMSTRRGDPVGEVYKTKRGWGYTHYPSGEEGHSYGSREDVIKGLKKLHKTYYGIKGKVTFANEETKKIGPKDKADQGEYGYEGDMAMSQLRSIIRNAQRLHDAMEKDTDLPEWVQSKITLAEDYISTASNYLLSELEEGYYKDIDTEKKETERLSKTKSKEVSGQKADDKKLEKEKKAAPTAAKAEKVINKYKGIKNRINNKPAIEPVGTTTTSSHVAGDENVNS